MTREIPLTQGKVALVDDEDYEWLSSVKWSVCKQGRKGNAQKFRVMRMVGTRPQRSIMMHREIVGAKPGEIVDHINGDPLDNRRANLRICTQSQNALNSSRHHDNGTSQFKGVTWHSQRHKWVAQFRGKYLGLFETERGAALAYDRAALHYSPEFARLNLREEWVL